MTKGNVSENGDRLVEVTPKRPIALRVFYVSFIHRRPTYVSGPFPELESKVKAILEAEPQYKNVRIVSSTSLETNTKEYSKEELETIMSSTAKELGAETVVDFYHYTELPKSTDDYSILGSVVNVLVSFATIGIIPFHVSHNLHLKSAIRNSNGAILKEFDYEASATRWIGTLMFLFKGSRKLSAGGEMAEQFESRAIRTHLNEIAASGVL